MTITLRPFVDAELEEAARCQGSSFGFDVNPDGLEVRRSLVEFPRSLAAFEDGAIVGTAGILSYEMGIPGDRTLPTAGVTMVSVLPTHRRRGILTKIMLTQLEGIREYGDPMAALWASESGIYGRFGYGLSAESVDLKIERARATFASTPEMPGRLRMIAESEARESWPAFHDQVRTATPGMMPRSQAWWTNRVFRDSLEWRAGFTAQQYVNYEVDGELRGYIRYRRKMEWPDGLPGGTTKVEELHALTNDAYAALWQYAFGLDLMSTVVAENRPVDEPLFWMLSDPRRLHRYATDGLWLRPLDIKRCLEARRYAVEHTVSLQVLDDFLEGVGGTFLLSGGPGGASCVRTDRAAEISLSVADLGAVYLGGVKFTTLARAGRVQGDPAALRAVDAMFSWPTMPWCPEVF
jgi:predicted acetyltransferase